jgi:chromosome segregation ATPase
MKQEPIDFTPILENIQNILKTNNIEYDAAPLKQQIEEIINKSSKLTEDKLSILFKKLEVNVNEENKFVSVINKVVFLKNTFRQKINDQQTLQQNHKNEIEKLNQTIKEKDEKNIELIKSLETLPKENFERQISDYIKEVDKLIELNKQLEIEKEKINNELKKLNDDYVSDMNILNEKMIAKETQHADIKTKLANDIDSLRAEKHSSEKIIEDLNDNINELNKTIEDISYHYKVKNDELLKIKTDYEDIKSENAEYAKKLKAETDDNAKLQERIRAFSASIEDAEVKSDKMRNAAEKMKKECDVAKAAKAGLEDELQRIAGDVNKYTEDANKYLKEVKELNSCIKEIQERYDNDQHNHTQEMNEMIHKCGNLDEMLKKSNHELELIKSNSHASSTELNDRVIILEEEKEALIEKVKESENMLQSREKEFEHNINEYVQKLKNCENNMNLKVNTIIDLNKKLKDLETSFEEKENELITSKNQHREQIEIYESTIKELNDKHDSILKENESTGENETKLIKKIHQLENDIKELSNKEKELILIHENTVNEFIDKQEILAKEKETISETLNNQLTTRISQLEKELEEAYTNKEKIKNELNNSKQEFEKEIKLLKDELNNRNKQLEDVSNKHKEEDESSANLIKQLTEDNNKLNNKLNSKQEEYQNEIKELTNQIVELNSHNQIISQELISKPNEDLAENYEKDLNNLKEINERLSTNIIEKNELVRKLEDSLKVNRKEVENKIETIGNLDAQIELKDHDIRNFQNELKVITKANKDEKMFLEEEYKKKLFEADLIIQKLEERVLTQTSDKIVYQVKSKMIEIFSKIRDEVSEFKYLIDKRIISNIILHYFDKSNNEKIRSSLVDTLAGIMGFNDDERRILGLSPLNSGGYRATDGIAYFDRVLDILQSLFDFVDKL